MRLVSATYSGRVPVRRRGLRTKGSPLRTFYLQITYFVELPDQDSNLDQVIQSCFCCVHRRSWLQNNLYRCANLRHDRTPLFTTVEVGLSSNRREIYLLPAADTREVSILVLRQALLKRYTNPLELLL